MSNEENRTMASDTSEFGSTTAISSVLAYWKEFDLDTARGILDAQGLKIAEHQETSLRNRKKLAETTRDFKKASPEEKLKSVAALLKSFQEEVDNLTKRAKFSETAFLNIYQKLYEAPDPVPVLLSASDLALRLSELEREERKLRAELDEFRRESTHLKNQQATVRRLEERNRQLEQQLEEKSKEMADLKGRVIEEESVRNQDALKERESLLQEELRVARETVLNMKRLHELSQSQLFELAEMKEEQQQYKQSELNLLTDEVDRAQERLKSLEREKESLKAQLTQLQKRESTAEDEEEEEENLADAEGGKVERGKKAGRKGRGSLSLVSAGDEASWETSLRAKEKMISELHVELHNLEMNSSKERKIHGEELKKLHAVLTEKDEMLRSLRDQLSDRPSHKHVEELRQRVKMLQAVGYNTLAELDDWEDEEGGKGERGGREEERMGSKGKKNPLREDSKLENLLMEKNRKLEHELTQLKLSLSEKSAEGERLVSSLGQRESELKAKEALIAKLEEDITTGVSSSLNYRLSSSLPFSLAWDAPSDGNLSSSESNDARSHPPAYRVSRTASGEPGLQGAVELKSQENMSSASVQSGAMEDSSGSMLQVVCSQRDRFKSRMNALEEELRASKDQVSSLSLSVSQLKAENVKLYERIRYAQEYNRKRRDDLESGSASEDVEMKYKKMYEENVVNPFAAFSNKEREQRVKDLGIRDRITLSGGQLLLSNKVGRTFLFFYTVTLHLLVFFSLFQLSKLSHYGDSLSACDIPSKQSLIIRNNNVAGGLGGGELPS